MKSRHPLLKLLIYILGGYLVGYITSPDIYLVITFSVIALLSSLFTSLSTNIKYLFLASLIGLNLYSNTQLYHFKSLDNHISNSFEGLYDGEIQEVISINNKYKRFIATGIIYSSIFKKPHECKSIVTLFDKENNIEVKPGLEFVTNSIFKVGTPKILKEDFNEKSYLISNKSHFYATTNSNKFSIQNDNYKISTLLYNIRSEIKHKIHKNIPDSNIANVVIALTTGDKSGIDKTTKESFSLTGTAHVLAISGLHVGIFSLIIFTLIGFFKSRKKKFIIFSLLIWFFVIVTGGHPSAIRAAIMATLTAFLIYYGKIPNPINILLFTAIFYIVLDPIIIYSVSFQLSIFAISGIILFYKPIYLTLKKLFYFENLLSRFVASSFAISFAATIPTAILTSYYFNSFSIIFPIANLLILPLMTFASFQSIFFVIFSSLGFPTAELFAKTAYLAIDISLDINTYLSDVSQVIQLNISDLNIISIISSIILLYLLTAMSVRKFLYRVVISSIALFLIYNHEFTNYKSLTILPREQVTSLLVEDKNTIYVLMADRKKYDYLQYDHALTKYLINRNKTIKLLKSGNVSINFEDNYLKYAKISSNFISINQINDISKRLNYNLLYRIDKNND